jgi:hypothetical protein
MNEPSTAESENQSWGIYFRDREYTKLLGDPLRMVIVAPTKAAAEAEANRLGFDDARAHPVTSEQANRARQLSPAPTIDQVRTAIEVLEKLAEKMEQTAPFKTVVVKLQDWHDELPQKSKPTISHHV